eukprot:1992094-Amphidinium_carterae.1
MLAYLSFRSASKLTNPRSHRTCRAICCACLLIHTPHARIKELRIVLGRSACHFQQKPKAIRTQKRECERSSAHNNPNAIGKLGGQCRGE